MVIISGGIDLSVGSIYALSGVLTAMALRATGGAGGGTVCLGIALCLGIGLLCGLLNGLMIVGLRVHPVLISGRRQRTGPRRIDHWRSVVWNATTATPNTSAAALRPRGGIERTQPCAEWCGFWPLATTRGARPRYAPGGEYQSLRRRLRERRLGALRHRS